TYGKLDRCRRFWFVYDDAATRVVYGNDFLCCADTAGEAHNKNGRGNGGRKSDLAQPVGWIECEALPEAALCDSFERFLQTHAGGGQQVRSRLFDRKLRNRRMELAHRL